MTAQTIFITGAASGLGQEVARHYAEQGANLALFDLEFNTVAHERIESLRQCDQQAIRFYSADITDLSTTRKQFEEAAAQIGSPNLVLHCAGIQKAGTFDAVSQEEFERVVSVNLFGSRNVAEACIPLLRKTDGEAKLVFVASMAGLVGNYSYASYCSSKFGVVGLAQVLRMELKPENIQVQVICPPEVDTPMVHEEHKTIHPVTLKLKLMAGTLTVEQAVDAIIRGIKGKQFYIIPGQKARIAHRLSRWLPNGITNAVADSIIKKELLRSQ